MRSEYELKVAKELGNYINQEFDNPLKPIIFRGVLTGFTKETMVMFNENLKTLFAKLINGVLNPIIKEEFFKGRCLLP